MSSNAEKQKEWSRTYRERHREEIAHRKSTYYQQNKERINAKKREYYHQNKKPTVTSICPLCQIDYTKKYLMQHITHRHKKSEEEAECLIKNSAHYNNDDGSTSEHQEIHCKTVQVHSDLQTV